MNKLQVSILALTLISLPAFAADKTAINKHYPTVTYTLTDKPCPTTVKDEAPVVVASSYDSATGKTIHGCAIDYGDIVEIQLSDDVAKKRYTILVPSKDFK